MVDMVVCVIFLVHFSLSLTRFSKQEIISGKSISDKLRNIKEELFLRLNLYNYFLKVFLGSLLSFESANVNFIYSVPIGVMLFLEAVNKIVLEFKANPGFFFFFFNEGPSNVSDIEIRTNTTAASLTWQNLDRASDTYTYHLLIEKDGNSSKATQLVTDMGVTSATVTELIPGSVYTVEIFTEVGNSTQSLAPSWQSFCTGE